MVNYETMLLIGVSLAVVFFGTRCYYESRIKRIMKDHARSDEVVGEIIGKYIELIAMNFSLVSKLNIYEKKYGKLDKGEFDENDAEDSMSTDEIKIINAMANHIPKGQISVLVRRPRRMVI